jgi:hypothetical protein
VAILSHADATGRESKVKQHRDFRLRLSELIVCRVRIPEEYGGLDFADDPATSVEHTRRLHGDESAALA